MLKEKIRIFFTQKLSAQPFAALLLFGLPLIVTNGFYNITQTKSVFFYAVSLLTVFVFALRAVFSEDENKEKTPLKKKLHTLLPTDIAFAVFLAFIVLAALLSEYRTDVWYGGNARYQGALTYLLYFLFYLIVSRNLKGVRLFLYAGAAAFCIVCALGVLNCFDIDFFGYYSRLSKANQSAYISTIGNINFYSSYMCLLFPPVLCGFCMTEKRVSRIAYAAALIVGSFGMMVTSSESFVIGFLSALVIIPLFLYNDVSKLKKYLLGICIIVLSAQIFMFIYNAAPVTNVAISKLLSILVRPMISGAVLAMCALLFLLVHFVPKSAKYLKWLHIAALCIGLGGLLLCFILANTVGIGRYNSYFELTAKWGSYRGEIWQQCIQLFREFSWKEKLFGIGPEALQRITVSGASFQGKKLDQAHNEYLHYLLTSGICGMNAYLALLGSVIYTTVRKCRDNMLCIGLFSGIAAFCLQAFVNLAQPFTTPILFTFIAVISGICNQKKTPTEPTAKAIQEETQPTDNTQPEPQPAEITT